jgi:hypothetical protein
LRGGWGFVEHRGFVDVRIAGGWEPSYPDVAQVIAEVQSGVLAGDAAREAIDEAYAAVEADRPLDFSPLDSKRLEGVSTTVARLDALTSLRMVRDRLAAMASAPSVPQDSSQPPQPQLPESNDNDSEVGRDSGHYDDGHSFGWGQQPSGRGDWVHLTQPAEGDDTPSEPGQPPAPNDAHSVTFSDPQMDVAPSDPTAPYSTMDTADVHAALDAVNARISANTYLVKTDPSRRAELDPAIARDTLEQRVIEEELSHRRLEITPSSTIEDVGSSQVDDAPIDVVDQPMTVDNDSPMDVINQAMTVDNDSPVDVINQAMTVDNDPASLERDTSLPSIGSAADSFATDPVEIVDANAPPPKNFLGRHRVLIASFVGGVLVIGAVLGVTIGSSGGSSNSSSNHDVGPTVPPVASSSVRESQPTEATSFIASSSVSAVSELQSGDGGCGSFNVVHVAISDPKYVGKQAVLRITGPGGGDITFTVPAGGKFDYPFHAVPTSCSGPTTWTYAVASVDGIPVR